MYEGLLLVALVVVVLLAIRPTKINPVVVHKPGFHATLAPGLVRTQSFVERISGEALSGGDIATQYFEGEDSVGKFLLAVGFRGGILYFQAILPTQGDANDQAIRRFSELVMVNIPLSSSQQDAVRLREVVERAAVQLKYTNLSSIDE